MPLLAGGATQSNVKAARSRSVRTAPKPQINHTDIPQALSDLWQYGTSVPSALAAWRDLIKLKVHRLAIVKVLLVVVLTDGPLLQRALDIVPHTRRDVVPMTAHIAPQVPAGYTSSMGGGTLLYNPRPEFVEVLSSYDRQKTMLSPFNTSCIGMCSASLLAAGLEAKCNVSTKSLDYTDTYPYGNSWTSLTSSTISSGVCDADDHQESLVLTSGGFILPAKSCKGHTKNITCDLRSAIVRYEIDLHSDGTITFAPHTNLSGPSVFARSNNTDAAGNSLSNEPYTTLGGLEFLASDRFSANFNWTWNPMHDWQETGANLFAVKYMPQWRKFTCGQANNQTCYCPGNFTDPNHDILAAYNEILFRLSLHAAQTSVNTSEYVLDPQYSMYQSVNVTQTDTRNVYRVVPWAMWTAVGLMLLGTVAVLWTIWGWWDLGMDATLDPAETAKAMGAPIAVTLTPTSKLWQRLKQRHTSAQKYSLWTLAFWKDLLRKKKADGQSRSTMRLLYGMAGTEKDEQPSWHPEAVGHGDARRLLLVEAQYAETPKKGHLYLR